MAGPTPPPGFELLDAPSSPAPPPGFELVQDTPLALPQTASPIDYAAASYQASKQIPRERKQAPLNDPRTFLQRLVPRSPDELVPAITRAMSFTPGFLPLAGLAHTSSDEGVRDFAQGATLGFSDELGAAARMLAGDRYTDALTDERARLKDYQHANALVGDLTPANLAGSMIPALATRGATAPTLVGRAWQAAKIGAKIGAIHGFGTGEDGLENRSTNALMGAGVGAVTGPLAVAGLEGAGKLVTSLPRAAQRLNAAVRGKEDYVPDRIMLKRMERQGTTPTEQLAEYEAGQRLVESRSPQQMAQDYGRLRNPTMSLDDYVASRQREAAEYLPEALVDIGGTPMQKLGRQIKNMPSEGSRRAEEFVTTRQGGDLSFQKASSRQGPQNQYERLVEDLKSSLRLNDRNSDFAKVVAHIKNERSSEANTAYKLATDNQERFDLMPALRKWRSEADQQPGLDQKAALQKALAMFEDQRIAWTPGQAGVRPWAGQLAIFDRAKRALDEMIEGAGGYTRKLLRDMKSDLLEQVHFVKAVDNRTREPILANALYKEARDAFANKSALMDAAEQGRSFVRQTGEVTVQDFRAMSKAEQVMFRMGALRALSQALGGKALGPTADFTHKLRSPQMIETLRAILPGNLRTGGRAGAELTELVNREMRMSRTANRVLGNSTTAEQAMEAIDVTKWTALARRIREANGIIPLALATIESATQKMFGMSEQVSNVIARQIFSSDPRLIRATLQRLSRTYGDDRVRQFGEAVGQVLNRGARLATAAVETSRPPNR